MFDTCAAATAARVGFLTVTVHEAVLFPSSVFTVITAVPFAFAVTRPELETDATLLLLLDHVTFRFAASRGATVARSCLESPTVRLSEDEFRVTPVTWSIYTVTLQTATRLPSFVVTLIFVVPSFFAATMPPATSAIDGSSLDQV